MLFSQIMYYFCHCIEKRTKINNRRPGLACNLMGSITVWLTSCLFCVDSAALHMLNEQKFYLIGQNQISQTGGQPYIDTSPV